MMFPGRAAALEAERFTHHGRQSSALDRLIGAGIAYRALRRKDFGRLAGCHLRFWSGAGSATFHAAAAERFDSVFLRHYAPLIDELERFLGHDGPMPTVCEIGSGSGLLMHYLAKRLSRVERFIGIDLCEATTTQARASCQDSRLEFVSGDAMDFIGANGGPNWVYITHNGVLEYFAPEAARRFFEMVSKLRPATLALIEPVGLDHDLDRQPESCPYGQEFAFSHNYPLLLKSNGFRIVYQHEEPVFDSRVLMILATNR